MNVCSAVMCRICLLTVVSCVLGFSAVVFFVCFSTRYQQILHRNLVYLATIADSSPDNTPPSSNVKTNHKIHE